MSGGRVSDEPGVPDPAVADPNSPIDPGRELGKALAAYEAFLNEVVPESQYYRGKRENPERIAYLGDIIQRAAARRREEQRRRATP